MYRLDNIILNEDIIGMILDYLVGSLEYHKKNYDKVTHNMNVIFNIYDGHKNSCVRELPIDFDDNLKKIIYFNDNFNVKENKKFSEELIRAFVNEEGIPNLSFMYDNINFIDYVPFYKKYFNKPWKYILETKKRREISLWS